MLANGAIVLPLVGLFSAIVGGLFVSMTMVRVGDDPGIPDSLVVHAVIACVASADGIYPVIVQLPAWPADAT